MPISRKRITPNRGVSQQPRDLRFDGQVDASVNFHVNNLNTLCKRFGSKFVAKLPNAINSASCLYHIVNYGAGNAHQILLEFNGATDGGTPTTRYLRAWNMETGAQLNVTVTPNMNYVSGGTPSADLRVITVGDDSYVLNTTKTVAMTADVPTTDNGSAFVFLRKGDFSAEYTLKVRVAVGGVTSDVVATVKTWDGRLSNGAPMQTGVSMAPSPQPMQYLGSTKTEDIIEQLVFTLNSKLSALTGVTSGVGSYVITNGGVGYGSAPTGTVSGGGGGGATVGPFVVQGGRVVSVGVGAPGVGYTYSWNSIAVNLTLGSSTPTKAAVLAAVTNSAGGITDFAVIDGGAWYNFSGAVTCTPTSGVPFAGTWTRRSGLPYDVTGVTITNAGTLYPTSPYVVLSGGSPATPATITPVIVPVEVYAERLKQSVQGANSLDPDPYMGSIMEIRVAAGSGFTIEGVSCTDSAGDTALLSAYKRVPRVQAYLPLVCRHDTAIEVVGEGDIEQDNYWVQFVADEGSGATGKGYWLESNKPGSGEFYKLDASTLPHKITVNAAGTAVTYSAAAWADRSVGEVASVPNPSIVGKTINDIALYRDRLCFLNDTSIVLSAAGAHTNIWRTTLLQLLDSDPIDLDVATNQSSALRSLASSSQGLFLFSDTAQFLLRGSDVLSPRTAEIAHIGTYENRFSNSVRPYASGGAIIFPVSEGAYSGVNQLAINQDGVRYSKLTASVPQYILGDIGAIAGSLVNNIVVFRGSAGNDLYVYRYYDGGRSKQLSAWYKWTLPSGTVRQMACIADKLYVVFSNSHSTPELCVETIDLTQDPSTIRYLDRYATASSMSRSYSSGTGLTTITLPWNYSANDTIRAAHATAGVVYTVAKVSTPTITIVGDIEAIASSVIIGVAMTSSITLSQASYAGDVQQRLRGLSVGFANSGKGTAIVTSGLRAAVSHTVSKEAYPSLLLPQGGQVLNTGCNIVPLWGDPDKTTVVLESSEPHPFTIPYIEWLMVAYQKRG